MGFSRQEYWSGLPCYPPGDLPHPGIKPEASCIFCLAGGFSTCEPLGKLRAKLQELFIPTFFFSFKWIWLDATQWKYPCRVRLVGIYLFCSSFTIIIFYLFGFFVCLFVLFFATLCHILRYLCSPNRDRTPHRLEWKHIVLSTGLPGKSLVFCYYNLMYAEWDALFQMFWWQFYLLKWRVT